MAANSSGQEPVNQSRRSTQTAEAIEARKRAGRVHPTAIANSHPVMNLNQNRIGRGFNLFSSLGSRANHDFHNFLKIQLSLNAKSLLSVHGPAPT